MNRTQIGLLAAVGVALVAIYRKSLGAQGQPPGLLRLLQQKQKADPSFQYAYDPKRKAYYLTNRAILRFKPGTSLKTLNEWFRYYESVAAYHQRPLTLSIIKVTTNGILIVQVISKVGSKDPIGDLYGAIYGFIGPPISALGPSKIPPPNPPNPPVLRVSLPQMRDYVLTASANKAGPTQNVSAQPRVVVTSDPMTEGKATLRE